MCVYIYIYIYIHAHEISCRAYPNSLQALDPVDTSCVLTSTNTYTCRDIQICLCTYIYIYIYMCIYIAINDVIIYQALEPTFRIEARCCVISCLR